MRCRTNFMFEVIFSHREPRPLFIAACPRQPELNSLSETERPEEARLRPEEALLLPERLHTPPHVNPLLARRVDARLRVVTTEPGRPL